MGELADRINANLLELRKSRQGPRCSIGALLEALDDDDDRAALQRLLDDEKIAATRISDFLEELEVPASYQQISHHRRGRCRCGRDPRERES